MVLRIEAAMERYERERMKPKHLNYWSKIRQNGVRLPMRKPAQTRQLRIWAEDAHVTNEIEA